MAKRYKTVGEMIKSVGEDDKFKQEALEGFKDKSLGRFLFVLRCDHKLKQKELAQKIGCSQAKISKIESAKNNELSIKDFMDYGQALGLRLEVGFRDKNARSVDMVKYHAFQIQQYLQQLADLAKEDEQIGRGVLKFHFETLINLNKMVIDNAMKMDSLKFSKETKVTPGLVNITGTIEKQSKFVDANDTKKERATA